MSKSQNILLFALSLLESNTIQGRVNLNKILAYLERKGFILEERFLEKPMGSCCENYNFISQGVKNNFVEEQTNQQINYYRNDFKLTPKGEEEFQKIKSEFETREDIDEIKQEINKINSLSSKEASLREHEQLLYEIENPNLRNKYFKERKSKINSMYSKLKQYYDELGEIDLKNRDEVNKKGYVESVLIILNKIKHIYYEPEYEEDERRLCDNSMGQYYIIYLSEIFLKEYEQNDKFIQIGETIINIAEKYDIFDILDIKTGDEIFLKL